ncbi:hypothetical protein FRC00_005823, partial [Tulasnella sp. 408]
METSSASAFQSTKRQAGPNSKQPIRDPEFDISHLGQYAPLAVLKISQERFIASSDEKKTLGGLRPLILQARSSVESPLPSYGFAGSGVGGPGAKQRENVGTTECYGQHRRCRPFPRMPGSLAEDATLRSLGRPRQIFGSKSHSPSLRVDIADALGARTPTP